MRIIAIETSGMRGSLAACLGQGDEISTVGEVMLPADRRSAQSLAPALRELLVNVNWPTDAIDLIAVAAGPGSFTGLRIGVTTAKTLAYAVGGELIGVNTLAVLAAQVPPADMPLWAILDAQRGELFVARSTSSGGGDIDSNDATSIMTQEEWLGTIKVGDRVTGPALRRVLLRLPAGVIAAPESLWQPTAAAVAKVGWQAYGRGRRDDLWKLVPQYFRLSAAEEKARASERGAGG